MSSSLVRNGLSLLLVGAAACASGKQTGHSAVERAPATADDSRDDGLVKVLRAGSPGLNITHTGNGEIAVQLMRGPSSFYSSNGPLYLVDDVPYKPGPGGALVGINPYDIESIKALTKPDETALYGVRGANGIIVIKLKKPGKS
ncbi:MAG TPA: TonB-dependent receptor plug domain-containing protein [Gemmatimonadaceae bacterium]|nr:TonB-dependent receptor plug domain-containing protein [Gemmatimonadaceae bacterium]